MRPKRPFHRRRSASQPIILGFLFLLLAGCTATPASPTGKPRSYAFLYYKVENKLATVYQVNPDGTGQKKAFDLDVSGFPLLSPDGRQLAMLDTGKMVGSVVIAGDMTLINPASGKKVSTIRGVGQTQLEFLPFEDNVGWSPDGKKIAYLANPDPHGPIRLYVSDIPSAGHRPTLVSQPDYDVISFSWSPDGKKLAFIQYNYADRHYSIVTARADGTEQRVVVNMADTPYQDADVLSDQWFVLCQLAWSPDGQYISFEDGCNVSAVMHSEHKEIYVTKADGSATYRLTDNGSSLENAHTYAERWADDSRSIQVAWSIYPSMERDSAERATTGITRYAAPDFKETDHTSPAHLLAALMVWAPQGDSLAWLQYSGNGHRWIEIGRAKDGHLLADQSPARITSELCYTLMWSPDGQYVASTTCGMDGPRTVVIEGRANQGVYQIDGATGTVLPIGWIPVDGS